ncbi:MAG TPA: hypothetical protein VFY35_07550 [Burkholderiaceae bacterium]|nr:hypothetical protein [Burkholderiaceae bacterium]
MLHMHSPAELNLPVDFGNAGALNTCGTGWFIGYSEWTREGAELRFMPHDALAQGLCVKWFEHATGDPNGEPKPLSTGRTMSVLVSPSSEFRIEFSIDATFPPESTAAVVLRQAGDFAIWGAGVYHRAFGVQRATVITVRWAFPAEQP